MKQQLRLREIIWEVTDECYNNCDYCGSKDILNVQRTDVQKIKRIATAIGEYPAEDLVLSGGDPTLIPEKVLKEIKELSKCEKLKLVMNPLSLQGKENMPKMHAKIRVFDVVGLSINNDKELQAATDYEWDKMQDKTTIITNFNLTNIWHFDKIAEYVRSGNLTWQIQFTIDEKTGLYNNPDAIEHLFEKINDAMDSGLNIVIADNMNSNMCGAAIQGIGILSTGEVIPCLALRSTRCNPKSITFGNLAFGGELKKIFEEEMNAFRFRPFKCCKDFCKNVVFVRNSKNMTMEKILETIQCPTISEDPGWPKPPKGGSGESPFPMEKQVVMYGVANPGAVMVYGVVEPVTYVYGVVEPHTLDFSITITKK